MPVDYVGYTSPEIISKSGELLRKPLSLAQEDLEQFLIDMDSIRYDIASATTEQLQLLHEKRKQMLWPKDADKSLTELDRTTRLNADIAPIERDYQMLIRIEKLVEDKIQLALMLLTN
jgi:hypothetical protein